ncbi:DNA-processing protein DprA [Variovorax ginsengisoli]|uniref:DNA processing protein n=1 Tax=Variovorax ginsengisoli TaxID=363844 RepID=A0ABT9S7T6_9BURK|nr:DNA-processing protein DprA [Variovorax ginsengisoli]MDP9900275.1 DNA processing protein [Variovorax ginsengisoli]
MERDELSDWLRLQLTPGVGDLSARRLLAAFGLPGEVFGQPEHRLREHLTPAQTRAVQQRPDGFDAQLARTWQWLQGSEADGAVRRIVTWDDPTYPSLLLQTEDPPPMLYVLGPAAFDTRDLGRSIAIVGSRNPTPQGTDNARAFGRALVEAGIPVISGLALGVDGAAHLGALEGAGDRAMLATVAVVGTGLDRVYPARHRALAHRISAQGLIVSEFPLGTPPLHQNFPKRNRIIAGMSRGTLVVEAALLSGSLITARLAIEQGREVFAIPGSIHSPQSRGCHALIRQGAKLVETVHDVQEELPMTALPDDTPELPFAGTAHDPDAASLLAALGHDPVGLDALCARTGFSAADLQGKLLELELDGHVARLPGGLFQRVARA